MKYLKERQYLMKVIRELITIGKLPLEGGGFSFVLEDGNILTTPTGGAEFLRWNFNEEDLVVTNLKGEIIEKGKYLSFADICVMLHVYNLFPNCKAIVHLHAPYSQAFTVTKMPIPPTLHQTIALGEIPCLDCEDDYKVKKEYLNNPFPVSIPPVMIQRPDVYVVFSKLFNQITQKLKNRGQELDKTGLGFLVEKHGLFALANTLDKAVDVALRIESGARVAIYSKILKIKE